jgi:hypothetical protein
MPTIGDVDVNGICSNACETMNARGQLSTTQEASNTYLSWTLNKCCVVRYASNNEHRILSYLKEIGLCA